MILCTVLLLRTSLSAGESVPNDSSVSVLPYGFSNEHYEQQKVHSSDIHTTTNPVELFFSLAVKAYQEGFSSLDGSTCQFRPSCSHFAALALKKKGPFIGTLMAADRLLRCNPWTRGKYGKAEDGFHNADPIERYLEHDHMDDSQ